MKTPIFRAVQGRNVACVQAILKNRGNPNETGGGVTPLFLAMEQGSHDCLQLLIEYKADVNSKRSWDGADALEASVETTLQRVVRMRVASMGTTSDSVWLKARRALFDKTTVQDRPSGAQIRPMLVNAHGQCKLPSDCEGITLARSLPCLYHPINRPNEPFRATRRNQTVGK